MPETTAPVDEMAEMRQRLADLEGHREGAMWALPQPPGPVKGTWQHDWMVADEARRKREVVERAAEAERIRVALEERAAGAPELIERLKGEIVELEAEAAPYQRALNPILMSIRERNDHIRALKKLVAEVVEQARTGTP